MKRATCLGNLRAVVGALVAVGAIACAESTSPAGVTLVRGLYVLDSIAPGPGAVLSAEIDYSDTSATFTTIEFDSITIAGDSISRRRARVGEYLARGGAPVSTGYVEQAGPARLLPRGDEVVISPALNYESPVSLKPDGNALLRSISSSRTRCDGGQCHVVSAQVLHARYSRR